MPTRTWRSERAVRTWRSGRPTRTWLSSRAPGRAWASTTAVGASWYSVTRSGGLIVGSDGDGLMSMAYVAANSTTYEDIGLPWVIDGDTITFADPAPPDAVLLIEDSNGVWSAYVVVADGLTAERDPDFFDGKAVTADELLTGSSTVSSLADWFIVLDYRQAIPDFYRRFTAITDGSGNVVLTPAAGIDLNGVRVTDTSYSVEDDVRTVVCFGSAGPITLPDAAEGRGREVVVVNFGAEVTVQTSGSGEIGGPIPGVSSLAVPAATGAGPNTVRFTATPNAFDDLGVVWVTSGTGGPAFDVAPVLAVTYWWDGAAYFTTMTATTDSPQVFHGPDAEDPVGHGFTLEAWRDAWQTPTARYIRNATNDGWDG